MKRPFAVVGFSYIVSLIVASYLGVPICIAIAVLSLICAIVVFFSMQSFRFFKAVTAVFFTVAAAFLVFGLFENLFYEPISKIGGNEAEITGQICEDPEYSNSTYKYVIKLEKVIINGEEINSNSKIKITSYQKLNCEPFDKLNATVVLSKLQNTEQSSFDNVRYNKSKGIYLTGYLKSSKYKIIRTERKPIYYYAIMTRHAISSAIDKYVWGNEGGLAAGILIGDTGNLLVEDKTNFTNIGISHLLAVSGTQTSLIMQYLLLLLCFFKLPKKISAGITAGAVAFFMAITGFSPSVTRAGIMSIVCCLAIIIRRNADVINSLGFSALVLCLINPYAATDVGLLLSLTATLGMVVVSPKLIVFSKRKLEKCPKKLSKFISPLCDVLCETIGASLFTFPILIFSFGKISLVSLLANMIEVPISLFVTLLAAVVAILSPLTFLSFIIKPIALILRLLCALMIGVARLLSKIPFANISADYYFIQILVVFLIAVSILYIIFRKKGASVSVCAVCWCFALVVGIFSYSVASHGVVTISTLTDEGACIVTSNGHAVLLDIPKDKYYNYLVKDYLKSKNIKTIDAVVLSKYDNSKVTAVESISKDIEIKKVFVPYKSKDDFIFSSLKPETIPVASEIHSPYGVTIKLLPDKEQDELVALVSCKNSQAFVTGTEMSGDYSIYNEQAFKSNLLVFSQNPNEELLKSVSPTYSCGGAKSDSSTISTLILLGSSIQNKDKIYMSRGSESFVMRNYTY